MQKMIGFFRELLVFVFQITLLYFVLFRVIPVPYTPLMFQRTMEAGSDTFKIEKEWVPIESMGLNLPWMSITGEDPKFFKHHGFDFEQIMDAISKNISKGKNLRGASTISQQTAKNLFLLPVRSFIRKGLEVPLTALMELMWTKKRILEVYLNIIEMGPGIFGGEAAAQQYFHKSAGTLTRAQAAAIVSVYPAPLRRNPAKMDAKTRAHQRLLLRLCIYVDKKPFSWVKK